MVKSLKAKIFLVEMNWKYVISVCQGVIDKRGINGSFNNIDFYFRQDYDYKEKSLMYVFDFEGRIKKCTYLGNCVLLLLFLRIIKRRFNPVLKLCEKTGNFVGIGTYDGREREDYCSTILQVEA